MACRTKFLLQRHGFYSFFCSKRFQTNTKVTSANEGTLIANHEMNKFAVNCMLAVGTKKEHAQSLADVLVAADYRGHFSHGANRLDMYVHDIQSGVCASNGDPSVIKESTATAYVDGSNLLGPVVGNFCMQLAIKKAEESGMGWVVAKGSNHYGIAGWYSMQAVDKGLLGMSFTNTSPLSMPTRSREIFLGTNPLTLAAPGTSGDSFVLDMATTTAAVGKVEINDRKQIPMPLGWGADSQGKPTTDPKAVLNGGGLMPLGGAEETAGYKGYGLSMLVEIFCGILGDASWGPHIRKWKNVDRPANLGQCFVAIDPECFASGFSTRMQTLMNEARDMHPMEGENTVLVAGDPERSHMMKCDREGGIKYHQNQIKHLNQLAETLQVQPLQSVF